MRIDLNYGDHIIRDIDLGIDFTRRLELEDNNYIGCTDINTALNKPIQGDQFDQVIRHKAPKTVAIIVEDGTRKNPEYPEILDVIISRLNKLCQARIFLIVAYGTHKHHTQNENIRLYGKQNLKRVTIVHHDSKDPDQLVEIGRDNDVPLRINKTAAKADVLMVIGSVKPHAFAGFTGGRKAILPGVAAYENIRMNHCRVGRPNVKMGVLNGNPIHEDMARKADLVHIDFSIQLVKNSQGFLADIITGEPTTAFEAGTVISHKLNGLQLASKFDVVVASIGGRPKDLTLYQSQRAIANAVAAVKEDGLVFLVGELLNGTGNYLLDVWLTKPFSELENIKESDIDIGVHSAYLCYKNLSRCETIYLYSEQSSEWAESHHFGYIESLDYIKEIVESKYDKKYSAAFLPNASDIMITMKET